MVDVGLFRDLSGRILWNMIYKEKGGPREFADSEAPERPTPTDKKSRKDGKRPAWMAED